MNLEFYNIETSPLDYNRAVRFQAFNAPFRAISVVYQMPYHPNAPSQEEIYQDLRVAADLGQAIILLHFNITYEGVGDEQNLRDWSTNFRALTRDILSYHESGYDDQDFQDTGFYKFLSESDCIHIIIEEWAAEEN